jgi:aminoglycoside phosphotransferase (APT) family kinase protein
MNLLGGAFFVMDYIPGKLLMYASPEIVPSLLGKTHAGLHQVDPTPLIEALDAKGIDAYGYSLQARLDWLGRKTDQYPWLGASVDWLIRNRPPQPEQLSVCHGDFHALNILVADGNVTGVLDWPGFSITDPAFDIANTIVLTTIPAKHLSASIPGFDSVDWNMAADYYLSAYEAHASLDREKLPYYRVRRCVMALVQGSEGHSLWQHPAVVHDLVAYIENITGIKISVEPQK